MPDDLTPSPAAEAAAPQPASPASQPAPADLLQQWRSAFSADTGAADEPAVVSNGTTEHAATAAASVPDAEPALVSDEGVSASAAPAPGEGADPPAAADKPTFRREQERQEHERAIADLQAKVSEYEAPAYRDRVRQEVVAEQAQRATTDQEIATARQEAERFDQSLRMLDSDPRLADLVPGDPQGRNLYQWREDRKDLIARYPDVERAVRADAERYIQERLAAADQTVKSGWDGIQQDIVAQIQASEKLPGVDKAAFQQPGVAWGQMAEHIHAAGATWKEGQLAETVAKAEARATTAETEAARVSKENEELRAQIAGDRRAPAVIGRTASGSPAPDTFDPSQGWRGNLRGAFDFATNGTG